ncbi:rhodanese-like domain-containing protein [Sabulilitoribacter arenilitoris]|uniref:Rhodanese-like domain-containing protein n=1 Tax=Wocania arenilitoris TaxID=2044858 RepID=A0AAE3JQH9_9FLAO|nr:rhodanese-like domain-containing protein [Wocania arenilitoris]MCF7569215.1 rhodanese-like domain-containing protein [Wocania arenilitoris]
MKQILVLILLLISILVIFSCSKRLPSKAKLISAEDMQSLLKQDSVLLIDVRTPKEFNAGHIKNALNINFFAPTFTEDIKAIDKEKPVILYCRSGKRSAKSAKKFIEAGFTDLYNLDGGIIKWKLEGFNIEK